MKQPTKGPVSALTGDEFYYFISRLGWLVFNAAPTAAFARHTHPLSTSADYLDVHESEPLPSRLAMEYWKDLARGMTTEEFSNKWFLSTPEELSGQLMSELDEPSDLQQKPAKAAKKRTRA